MSRSAASTTAPFIPVVTWRCVADSQTRHGLGEYSWCVTLIFAGVRTFRPCYNAVFPTCQCHRQDLLAAIARSQKSPSHWARNEVSIFHVIAPDPLHNPKSASLIS
jgi:hypothetical protein